MLTINSVALNTLTLETEEKEFTARCSPGNQSAIATASGALIRVVNDLGGPVTFDAVVQADAVISEDKKTMTFETEPAWVLVSGFGDKFTF